jgi:hypothetical protein
MRRIAIIFGATISLAIIFISLAHVVGNIPSLSPHLSRTQAAVCAFVVAFSYVALRFDGPASASHLRLKSSRTDSTTSNFAASAAKMAKTAPVSVGSGGECVSVIDMAMGGSGFITAVGGRVVEKETVRTRWILQACLSQFYMRHTPPDSSSTVPVGTAATLPGWWAMTHSSSNLV